MKTRTILILPTIYEIETTSHSNNHRIQCFCLDCLAKSKANREYKEYQDHYTHNANKICCKCGAMTCTAVINVFNINLTRILGILERSDNTEIVMNGELIALTIKPNYLSMLKGIHNGKVRSDK